MRFFQKANRRAELDVAYTGGFSPHQIMSFAAPLGVGLTSNGEYMDLEVHSLTSCEDVKTRLNAASVPGIEITSVKILPDKAGNAMASVAAAGYTVTFREGRGPHFDLAPAVERFLAKDEILITKETKKGSREINLKEGIYELKAVDGNSLYLLVDASSAGNIKPIDYEELIGDMNLNKLHEIFRSIVKKQEDKIDPVRSQYGNIEKDEVDMDIKMLYVEAYAREHKTFSFRKLLEKQNSKMEVIVTFLIILELMKTGKINISQENIFDDIMITSNV